MLLILCILKDNCITCIHFYEMFWTTHDHYTSNRNLIVSFFPRASHAYNLTVLLYLVTLEISGPLHMIWHGFAQVSYYTTYIIISWQQDHIIRMYLCVCVCVCVCYGLFSTLCGDSLKPKKKQTYTINACKLRSK